MECTSNASTVIISNFVSNVTIVILPSIRGTFFDEPFDEFEAVYGSGSQPDLASDRMSDHSDEFEYTGTREPTPSDPSA